MTGGYLAKPDLPGDFRQSLFMICKAIAMHQDDGTGADSGFIHLLHIPAGCLFVERLNELPMGANPFLNLDDRFIQHLRQFDFQVKQPRTGLIANA